METSTSVSLAAMSGGLSAHRESMASNCRVLWFSDRDRQHVHLEDEEMDDGLWR